MGETSYRQLRIGLLLLVLVVVACGGADGGGGALDTAADVAVDEGSVPSSPRYSVEIQPIAKAYCAPCHTTFASGGTNFAASYADNLKAADSCPGLSIAACGLQRVRDGSMPEGKECTGDPEKDRETVSCLEQPAISLWQDWIDAGAPQ